MDFKFKIPRLIGSSDQHYCRSRTIFNQPYFVCGLIAPIGSGKSTMIFNMIRLLTMDKHWNKLHPPNVLLFSNNVDIDPTYDVIKSYLTKKNIKFETHPSVFNNVMNDKTFKRKISGDHLYDFMNEYEREVIIPKKSKSNNPLSSKRDRNRSKPKIEIKDEDIVILKPETIIVLDDSNDDLKSNAVQRMVEYARHYRVKMFISTQSLHNIPPCIRSNMMYYILFMGIPQKKIDFISDEIGIPLDHYDDMNGFDTLFIDRRRRLIKKNILND